MLTLERPVVVSQMSSPIVLLAFTAPLLPRRGVATALAAQADGGATIIAAHPLQVPLHLPMDAPVVEGETRARELLDAVQARVAKAGVQAVTRIARGRSYRHALVEPRGCPPCSVPIVCPVL